jgi:GTP-binding protein
MIRYRQIQGVCNLGNVSSVVPLPMPCKEFIFFGKSNVGKSTLLNRLMQEEVAAVSKRPGKTKELLVCEVGPKSQVDSRITESKIFFVDCPGYGYATGVSKREIGQWGRLITTYLKRSSDNLMNQRFLCLLDINQ